MQLFRFVQMDFPTLLGPDEGRYVIREPDSEEQTVLVLQTAGAPERRLMRGRRPKPADREAARALPITRATVVAATPFADEAEAASWLKELNGDEGQRNAELDTGLEMLNRALHAHRAGAADPLVFEVGPDQASQIRIGYGSGDQLAEGEWREAIVLPRLAGRRRRVEALRPLQRLAAILGGREELGPWETLVLRARLDLDHGRPREAALQLRVGLEALLAELATSAGALADLEFLRGQRQAIGDAANAALRGPLDEEAVTAVADALKRCERLLRRQGLNE